jgi:hypothetical protein
MTQTTVQHSSVSFDGGHGAVMITSNQVKEVIGGKNLTIGLDHKSKYL